MKRILFLAFLFVSLTSSIMAQTAMTDAQIVSFIEQEQKAGTSQAQIVTKLMQRGVSTDRLREIRRKTKELGGNSTSGARNLAGEASADRSRSYNGDARNENISPMRLNDGTGKPKMNAGEWNGMQQELNTFMPDSMTVFDQELERLGEGKRKIFGHDIFNNQNLSFEPNMNIATPDNYMLGPGDVVFIDIYGASQKNIEASITPDGDINIENAGPIHISGLTVSKAQQKVKNQLSQYYSGSQIRLTVGQTKTMTVNVFGEVTVPGTYTLSAFSTVFHALYMAGGVNEIGTMRDIKVYRNDKLVASVDVYDYMLNGKFSGNIRLAEGDVIVVGPYDCLVNMTGKVKRPMFYEMKKGESLETALRYAGGFTGDAYTNSIRVMRKAGKQYSIWNVTEFDMSTFALCDEDSVGVDSVIPRYENMVELRGAVQRPGMYQYNGSVTTVKGLLNVAEGLKPEAFGQHAILNRMKEDRSLEAIAINVKAIMDGTEPDVALKNEDVLFVPSNEDATQERTIKIYGEVYYPGEYRFAEGMTVEDFILQAGGFKDAAARDRVNVSRRTKGTGDGEGRATAVQTYDIKLKEGLGLDGEKGFVLNAFDEVYVGKAQGYQEQAVIEIDGEVNYRGSYALPMKNARLSDLVAQAGGLSSDAYAKGARVIRKMDDSELRRRERQVADLRVYNAEVVSSINQNVGMDRKELVDSLILSKYLDEDTYTVGIDLEKALKNPGSKYDITLKEGDKLYIPQYDAVVKITGEVNEPTAVTFDGNKSVRHYIHAAGGYAGSAWKNHAFVIQPNGMVQTMNHGAKVEPGSQVVIPTRPIRGQQSWVNTLISAGTSLATVAALMITALK